MNMDRTFFTLILGIIGGMLVVIAAFIQYHDKKSADIETTKQKNKADSFQKQLLEAQKEFKDLQSLNLTTAINTLQKIEDASTKLEDSVNLAKYTLDNLTGGGYVPNLLITAKLNHAQGHHDYFSLLFQIINNSNIVFNDVEFTITDHTSFFMNSFTDFRFQPDGALITSFHQKTMEDVMLGFNPVKSYIIRRVNVFSFENAYATGFPLLQNLSGYYNSNGSHSYQIIMKWVGGTMNLFLTIRVLSEDEVILEKVFMKINEIDVMEPLNYLQFSIDK